MSAASGDQFAAAIRILRDEFVFLCDLEERGWQEAKTGADPALGREMAALDVERTAISDALALLDPTWGAELYESCTAPPVFKKENPDG